MYFLRHKKSSASPETISHIKLLGGIAIFLYCLSTASSAVWISSSFANLSAFSLTFITFSFSVLLFYLFHIKRLSNVFLLIKHFSIDVLWLNIITLFAWWFMFMALQRIEASIESAVYMGCVPIAVLFCDIFRGKTAYFKSLRSLSAFLIAILILLLAFTRSISHGVFSIADYRLLHGFILAAIAGIAGGIYLFSSNRFHKKTKASILDVLCIRFILLLLVTGWLGKANIAATFLLNSHLVIELFALALLIVVIPVSMLQISIYHLGAARVSIITPCVPVLALIIEMMLYGWPSLWIPVLVIAITGAIILSNICLNER